MEDMRAVVVDENARGVVGVVRIAADVQAFVDEQHLPPTLGRQPFSHHRPSKTGANDKIVEHMFLPMRNRMTVARAT